MNRALLVVIAVSGVLTGCRNNDFVYFVPPKNSNVVSGIHKLKEMQGNNRVDIVWVVDNSASMGTHQQAVIQAANDFMVNFTQSSGLKWTIALLSTDTSNRPYLGFGATQLDHTTADPVPIFQDAINRLGLSGHYAEKFFDPVMKAVRENPSYLRSNAMLALISVTDAPEQSESTRNPQDFLNFLSGLKGGDLTKSLVYGALGPQDWGCPQSDDRWEYQTSSIRPIIEATRGTAYKLCTTSFGKDLAAMGKDLVTRVVRSRLFLTERPKAGSIRIRHQGIDIPNGTPETGGYWLYDFEMNAVAFSDLSFAPDDNADVEVSYEIDDGLDVR